MRLRAILSLMVGAVVLAGCNQLISKEPWFRHDPAAPVLRDGVWLGRDADCAFDEAAQVEHWPSCASAIVIKDGAISEERAGSIGAATATATREADFGGLILALGKPLIWQVESFTKSEDGKRVRFFLYYGLEVKARDDRSRITRTAVWPVICGPLDEGGNVTRRPWPGLTVSDSDCTAASAEIVREAARYSRKVAVEKGDLPELRWVRDGSR